MSDAQFAGPTTIAHLFMLRPGPSHSINEFEPLCRVLSAQFTGEIWTPGSYEADAMLGRMRLRVVKELHTSPTRNFITFGRIVSSRLNDLRKKAQYPNTIVTSYDPFKSGLLARWAARRLKSPFVCEINGSYGDPNCLSHIKSAWRRRIRLLKMRAVGSFVLSRANTVKLLYDGQLSNFARPSRRATVRTFFDFCNTERFRSEDEEPIVLSVGYPFRTKGDDILCRAFLRIAPRFNDWKLVLIGHLIPDETRAAGFVDPRIVTLPGMPQAEMAQWMARCSIFALSSRSEGMPRVLIEAAAAAKSRVSSQVGGIHSMIDDGRDGLLFKSQDVDGLADRLERLMSDPELRHRLGAAAYARFRREFSPESYLTRYCELIEATLHNNPRRDSAR